MRRGLTSGALLAVVAAVVTAAAFAKPVAPAAPTTWTVWAGAAGLLKKPPPGVSQAAEALQFYPAALTIHAGDSVTIQTQEGHTATFLGKTGPSYFKFFAKKGVYSGINDSTGTPFWFNGKPKYVYTAQHLFSPAGGLSIADHTTLHNRTILAPDPHNPPGIKSSVTYTFPKAGTFTIRCLFHYPVMNLRVVVKLADAAIPSQADVTTAVAKQLAAAIATAKSLAKTTPTAKNTFWSGVSKNGVDVLQFFPAKLTVPVGTTVRFAAHSIVENHNQVFGGATTPWIKKYLSTSDQFPFGQVGPEEIYGTEPPGGYQYDGTNHGNGFLVTPITDKSLLTPELRAGNRVTFTQPGTYKFFCEIHGPDMSATVVVTP